MTDYLFSCIPAFWHLQMIFQDHAALKTPATAVYGRAGFITFSTSFSLQYGRAGCTFFINAGMSECPTSSQSGVGMNKNADAGTSPVPG